MRETSLVILLCTSLSCEMIYVLFERVVESAKRLINAKANLDLENNDHLAPVDLGLDSSNLQMKSFLSSIAPKSSRLQDYSKRF